MKHRYFYAVDGGRIFHIVIEEQLATMQDALCETAPDSMWIELERWQFLSVKYLVCPGCTSAAYDKKIVVKNPFLRKMAAEERAAKRKGVRLALQAKILTMARACKRRPEMDRMVVEIERHAQRACFLANGRIIEPAMDEKGAKELYGAIRLQMDQFADDRFTAEEAARLDAKLQQLVDLDVLRRQLEERHAAERDNTRTLTIQQLEACDKELEQRAAQIVALEEKVERRMARIVEVKRERRRLVGIIESVVDVLRGFEGALAEQVRRICVRELDAERERREAERTKLTGGNPGSPKGS